MAVAVFTPSEEVQRTLVEPWEKVEKGGRDFFREGWVDDPYITIYTAGLEEGLVLMDGVGVREAEEGTLGEAVEIMRIPPVAEGEDLTMLEKIRKMNVVTKQSAMVR